VHRPHTPYLCRLVVGLSLLVGCAEESKTPESLLTISATELTFGGVAVGAESQDRVSITNEGSETHEILSSSLVEGSSAVWLVDRDGDAELAPGDSIDIIVQFRPQEMADEDGRIQVRTSYEDEPSWFVYISGSGTASVTDEDGDGFSVADGDCDDTNASVSPAASEACDGEDTNCDGILPIEEADADYDGFRVCDGDCDDYDQNVHPGAAEICDEKDSDCDGEIPDFADYDGDGHSLCDGDCDDEEPLAFPGNIEQCDLIDNDCSGGVDDIDLDGDGYSPCAGGGDCDDEDPDAYPVLVDPSMEDSVGVPDGTPEAPYFTVQDGVDNLDAICRTVVLAPYDEAYEVAIAWNDRTLQINGGGVDPRSVTLRPPEGGTRIFTVGDNAKVTLVNLTITGGNAAGDGGAIYAEQADIELAGVIAQDNRCTGDGGAVAVASGELIVSDSVFNGNIAEDDGGAVYVLSGELSDSESRYISNIGTRGGAMLLESSNVNLEGSLFDSNTAATNGGAIAMVGGGQMLIEGNTFWSNRATDGSGGAVDMTDVLIPEGIFRNNWIADNASADEGGGVRIAGNNTGFMFVNNTLHGNQGGRQGAGLHVGSSGGTLNAENLYVWSNIISWSNGPLGIWVLDGANASVGYNTVFASSSGENYSLYNAEDYGYNNEDDPIYLTSSNDGTPSNDDLQLDGTSSSTNSGPADGDGPSFYTTWADLDTSRNDRGMYGGPGVQP
jgi:predicted outer membrane repeat protein